MKYRGLYYEEDRRRWRVRLYYQQELIWRSYHYDEHEALRALRKAQDFRRRLVKAGQLQTLREPPKQIQDLL